MRGYVSIPHHHNPIFIPTLFINVIHHFTFYRRA